MPPSQPPLELPVLFQGKRSMGTAEADTHYPFSQSQKDSCPCFISLLQSMNSNLKKTYPEYKKSLQYGRTAPQPGKDATHHLQLT